jgi:hypothetical protein
MACSGYFKSMFTGEYKEKSTNLVNIKEVKACHFEEMLQAIYPCRKSVTSTKLWLSGIPSRRSFEISGGGGDKNSIPATIGITQHFDVNIKHI